MDNHQVAAISTFNEPPGQRRGLVAFCESACQRAMRQMWDTTNLNAFFRGARAVSQSVQTEAKALFVVFCQGKPHLAIFIRPQ